ncbi:MAG: tetratricopeptide repeat protein, partial [Cyanobacteria bacterium P01_F01_bin.143]
MTKSLDQSALEITTEEEYRALTRSLRRRKGFGIVFVKCTPVGGKELIPKVETDLPNKNIGVLELDAPIDNLIERVAALPNQEQLNIVFISGLEKSLVEYIRPGYGGVGDYYKLDTVPPILNHLNWQRENFRDLFRHLCFVFLLPPFAVKYILHRAPDFADWRSGIVDVPTDRQMIEQETNRLSLEGDVKKYSQWTEQQRLERISEIQAYLTENPDLERAASLWFEQGNILAANKDYEAAVSGFDQAIKARLSSKVSTIKGFHEAWYNRGIALKNLGRLEEALTSYEKALDIKPDKDEAWYNRGNALFNLGRLEEAIASYEKALDIKPDKDQAWNNRGIALFNLGRLEEAIASYEKALDIKPDYHEAWNNRGIALKNLGRLEEAIAS